jgi:hypothetical protein
LTRAKSSFRLIATAAVIAISATVESISFFLTEYIQDNDGGNIDFDTSQVEIPTDRNSSGKNENGSCRIDFPGNAGRPSPNRTNKGGCNRDGVCRREIPL